MRCASLLLLVLLGASAKCKPIENSAESNANEVDDGTISGHKNLEDDVGTNSKERDSRGILYENQDITTSEKRSSETDSSRPLSDVEEVEEEPNSVTPSTTEGDSIAGNDTLTKNDAFSWLFAPFGNKLQLSPQLLFQERFGQLGERLNNLSLILTNLKGDAKSNGPAGLAHLLGLTDSGFYTNRLDPAGFFGGNGWFANKGGILGGPGAFLSTGSLFTDYPTPYRK